MVTADQNKPRFIGPDVPADVTALIVTFNSSTSIGALITSLREEALDQVIRVIVVDNASSDSTVNILRREQDVTLLELKHNLGYAGGLNVAMKYITTTDTTLILNPDLIIERGSIRIMRDRLVSSQAGVVSPRMLDDEGTTYTSLYREPSVLGALGEAVFGHRFPARPAFLREGVYSSTDYRKPHPVDWATGAALLLSAKAASDVGQWDERFFLYAEETDYLRRVREAGYEVWYEPRAVVRHSRGGSGKSWDLDRLHAVNRVRYARKHNTRRGAATYRAMVIVHNALRAYMSKHRAILRTLLNERSWAALPHAVRLVEMRAASNVEGSIVMSIHNEPDVLLRTLMGLDEFLETSGVEIVVVVNGSSDNIAERVRTLTGVTVVEMPESSKASALNKADDIATRWPRLYLDAEVQISPKAVADTFAALSQVGALAGRPKCTWDLSGAESAVRGYYRARAKMASAHKALWGVGVYGMSVEGHQRLKTFPAIVGDDLFVDQLFAPHEKVIVDTDPVIVRVPRTSRALIGALRRWKRGTGEAQSSIKQPMVRTVMGLLGTVRGPRSFLDACTYAGFTVWSRCQRRQRYDWERDGSSS